MKKLFCIMIMLSLLGCGAAMNVMDDAMKCDIACGIASAELTADRCDDVCANIKKTEFGQRVCRDVCVEALDAGLAECKPTCMMLVK